MVSDVNTMVLLIYAVVTVFCSSCFGIYMVLQVIPRYTMILSLKSKLLMYQKHGNTFVILCKCMQRLLDWCCWFVWHTQFGSTRAAAGPAGGPDPRAVCV